MINVANKSLIFELYTYIWHTTPWPHKTLVLVRWSPSQASRGEEDVLGFRWLTNMLDPESSSTKPHAIPLDHHPFYGHEFYINNVQILAFGGIG